MSEEKKKKKLVIKGNLVFRDIYYEMHEFLLDGELLVF